MRLGEIKCPKGSRRVSKRLGQGPGSGTGKTANNQVNLTGRKAFNKWMGAIKSVAQEVGYRF